MIYIITGPINSGKSTKLLLEYQKLNKGDGFYNSKIYFNNKYIGQRIVRLTTGESKPFSYLINYKPQNFDELYRFKDYSFSKSGLNFANEITNSAIDKNMTPIFIDEIGPLELNNKGFYRNLCKVLKVKTDIYLVVRNECLKDVISYFSIKKYILIY